MFSRYRPLYGMTRQLHSRQFKTSRFNNSESSVDLTLIGGVILAYYAGKWRHAMYTHEEEIVKLTDELYTERRRNIDLGIEFQNLKRKCSSDA